MTDAAPKSYSSDPTLYLYTSLTAGSSHIITATSRLETILKANKIPFRAIDCATDERARMLWGRRSKGKKIPGLVKFGTVIGDLDQIEEWNEYGELKDQINGVQDFDAILSGTTPAANPTPTTSEVPRPDAPARTSSDRHISISEPSRDPPTSNPASSLRKDDTPLAMAMRQAGAEAAAKAGTLKSASKPTSTPATLAEEQAPPTSAPTSSSTPTSLSGATDEDPENVQPSATAAKTPSQLAAEGKISSTLPSSTSPPTAPSTSSPLAQSQNDNLKVSNEQQMLDNRRSSSLTKEPSRLAESTTADDAHTIPDDVGATNKAEETEQPQKHGGAELAEVDKEEIGKVEKANAILEGEATVSVNEVEESAGVAAEDEVEKDVTGDKKTQDMDAKDEEAAGVSVGD